MPNIPAAYRHKVTAPSTKRFPFMKLPPKLRNNIYDLYFADIKEAQWFPQSVRRTKIPQSTRFMPKRKSNGKLKAHLALLHANQEVRAEVGPMFYNQYLANTEFHFDIDYHNGPGKF